MPSPSKAAETTKEKESPEPLLARGSDRLVLNFESLSFLSFSSGLTCCKPSRKLEQQRRAQQQHLTLSMLLCLQHHDLLLSI